MKHKLNLIENLDGFALGFGLHCRGWPVEAGWLSVGSWDNPVVVVDLSDAVGGDSRVRFLVIFWARLLMLYLGF